VHKNVTVCIKPVTFLCTDWCSLACGKNVRASNVKFVAKLRYVALLFFGSTKMDACESKHVEIFVVILNKYLTNSTVHVGGAVLRIGYGKYRERTAKCLRSELKYVHISN
jgi:hypothetical protein